MRQHLTTKILAVFLYVIPIFAGNSSFFRGIDPCPVLCTVASSDSVNWTVLHDPTRFRYCLQDILLDFAVYTPVDQDNVSTAFRACTSTYADESSASITLTNSTTSSNQTLRGNGTQAQLQFLWSNSSTPGIGPQAISGAKHIQGFFESGASENYKSLFVNSGDAVLGVYIGSQLEKSTILTKTLQTYIDEIRRNGISQMLSLQLCGSGRNGNQVFGIIADTGPSAFSVVQSAVRSWSDAKCFTEYQGSRTMDDSGFYEDTNGTTPIRIRSTYKDQLRPRAVCTTTQVVSGDTCATLATRCGISGAIFTTYNTASTLCSTLVAGQHVCCSSGTLPDFTPKQNSDGSCYAYAVKSGDFCASLAASYGITVALLETYNINTWGWNTCSNLQIGTNMCLSSGTPPMPAPLSNAVCGPQVPGTAPPSTMTLASMAALNPCPLNACCDIWGQCGTTSGFCTTTGSDRCISNCGQDLIAGAAPAVFKSVAYFEGFNPSRPCLNLDIGDLDMSPYTHIHMAFATLTPDFKIDISNIADQFSKFVSMTGISQKRILSIGGWAFSTSPDTYMIFRNAVQAANWDIVSSNIVDFITANGLDGVDIDWEYPGAPDIPGIPAGSADDGINYLILLYYIKAKLPSDKSLSIAVPASYWYLKAFPVEALWLIVDYFVFMTYDIHGQWDYGNTFSDIGCPTGNCLRSHINFTETYNSLVMITKAGVPSNQVIVGVSSYGRAFQMTTAGCTGPDCTYTGPASGAIEGRCTLTNGYISDAEIKEIIASDASAHTYIDSTSYSNILTYGSDQWVAYMDPSNKATRTSIYRTMFLGGITDWAVDLESFVTPTATTGTGIDLTGHSTSNETYKTVDCLNAGATSTAIMTGQERWDSLYANDAWDAAIVSWRTRAKGETLNFANHISNFFNGVSPFDCGVTLPENNCHQTFLCATTRDAPAASFLILNSFVIISEAFWNLYSAITDAEADLALLLGYFVKEFSPPDPDDKSLAILLDIVGIGLGAGLAPFFNNLLRGFGYFAVNPNELDNLKDTTYMLAAGGVAIAHDLLGGSSPEFTTDNLAAMGLMASGLTKQWQIVLTTELTNLFNGSDASIANLDKIIRDGKLVQGTGSSYFEPTTLDLKNQIEKELFLFLIPYSWSLNARGAFILDSGYACGTKGPLDYLWFTPSDGLLSFGCVNNKIYYLMSAYHKATAEDCDTDTGICAPRQFSPPPGLASVNSTGWAGLTVSDLITSAVSGYTGNGNKNGWTAPVITDSTAWDQLWDILNSNVASPPLATMPGVARIPVCGAEEASYNWIEGNWNLENYPCND